MIEKIFKKEDNYFCPCCGNELPEFYKKQIIDYLLFSDGYAEVDCPICRLQFVAEYEVCIKLSTEKE